MHGENWHKLEQWCRAVEKPWMGFARPRLGTVAQLALLRSQAPYRGFGRQVAACSNFNCADRMESVSSWFATLTYTLPTMQGRVAVQWPLFSSRIVFPSCAPFFSFSLFLLLSLCFGLAGPSACCIHLYSQSHCLLMKVQVRTTSCSKTFLNSFLFAWKTRHIRVLQVALILAEAVLLWCFFCFPVEPPTKNTLAATVAQYFWTFEKA